MSTTVVPPRLSTFQENNSSVWNDFANVDYEGEFFGIAVKMLPNKEYIPRLYLPSLEKERKYSYWRHLFGRMKSKSVSTIPPKLTKVFSQKEWKNLTDSMLIICQKTEKIALRRENIFKQNPYLPLEAKFKLFSQRNCRIDSSNLKWNPYPGADQRSYKRKYCEFIFTLLLSMMSIIFSMVLRVVDFVRMRCCYSRYAEEWNRKAFAEAGEPLSVEELYRSSADFIKTSLSELHGGASSSWGAQVTPHFLSFESREFERRHIHINHYFLFKFDDKDPPSYTGTTVSSPEDLC